MSLNRTELVMAEVKISIFKKMLKCLSASCISDLFDLFPLLDLNMF